MVTMEQIRGLASRIASEFDPVRIILFGSYARRDSTPDSDVDLLVVVPHGGKGWRRAAEIRSRMRPGFPLDLLVRAPEEVSLRLAGGDPFLREIVEKGLVLYERDDS